MLKKIIFFAMGIFFLAISGWSAAPISTLSKMGERVREITNQKDLDILADSTLYDLCNESIVWTSINIGGVESGYSFVTEADVSRYGLPDSTVAVIASTIYTQTGETKGIRAWWPQYFSQISTSPATILVGDDDTLGSDPVPIAYQYWADSVKLLPTPVRGDTIYFDLYVQHSTMDTTSDTLILFESYDYTEAALMYACARVYETVELYDQALYFKKEYALKRAEIREAQARRIEISITGK